MAHQPRTTGSSINHHAQRSMLTSGCVLALAGLLAFQTGCRDLQKRRVDIVQPSGADADLENRFGLTADAQDPSERDKELGYGRWKLKPEADGTESPNSPNRRKP